MTATKKQANESTAREILRSAYLTVLEKGFSDASVRSIAERAGVSKFMIHYYFNDKETLLVEVVKEVTAEMQAAIKGIIDKYSTTEERLEKGIADFWSEFKKDPGPLTVIFESVMYGHRIPEIGRRMTLFYLDFIEQVAVSIADDDSTLRDFTSEELNSVAIILFSMLSGLAMQYLRDPQLTDFDRELDMVIRSLKYLILS